MSTEQPQGIGHRILRRREELGLSRAALAFEVNRRRGKSGVDAKRVGRWESGVVPETDVVVHLADALGVSVRWLLIGEAQAA